MDCTSRVTRIGRFSWRGRLVPFEGGAILLDESENIPKQTFSYPILNRSVRDNWNVIESIEKRITELPVIQKRVEEKDAVDEENALKGLVEKNLKDLFQKGTACFRDFSHEKLSTNVFPKDGATSRYLTSNWNALRMVEGRPVKTESPEFEKLERLWRFSNELSKELSEEKIMAHFEDIRNKLGIMDEIRCHSLLKTVREQIKLLNDAYQHNNVFMYCPKCYEKSVDESDLLLKDRNVVDEITAIDGTAQKRRAKGDTPTLSQSMSRKGQLLKSSRMTFDIVDGMWACPLCEFRVSYSSDEMDEDINPILVHKVKEMIVNPLWDVLWRELDVERHRIRREKEAELRDNRKSVNTKLMGFQKDFVEERRLMKIKSNELYEKSKKTIIQLTALIDAFDGMDIIARDTASEERRRIERYSSSHLSRLEELSKNLNEAETELKRNVEMAFHGQETMLDYVDQVRASGRFLTREKEKTLQVYIGPAKELAAQWHNSGKAAPQLRIVQTGEKPLLQQGRVSAVSKERGGT